MDLDHPTSHDEEDSYTTDFLREDGRPKRRHSVSSVESDYQPSGDEQHEDDDGDTGGPPAGEEPEQVSSLSKRHSPPIPSDWGRPLKRRKGEYNMEYMSIINKDINDAAYRYIPHVCPDLTPSCVGIVWWTEEEKEMLFEGISRLGPDKPGEIADCIGTKSELEVTQYIQLLRLARDQRKAAGKLDRLVPTDFPAAVELTQACCSALEEMADALSLRQQAYEEALEKKRWERRGDCSWLVTQANHQDIELPATDLFRVRRWLQLSERIFMQSSVPDYNWTSFSDELPAMRTTCLEDFYSIAVTVTKRLVAAALFAADSRIKTKTRMNAATRKIVYVEDVDAAVMSLGLSLNSQKFWTGCPRRLRLDIVADTQAGESDEPEVMEYDDVERTLGWYMDENEPESCSYDSPVSSLSDTPSADDETDDDTADEQPPSGPAAGEGELEETTVLSYPGINEDEIQADLKELLSYTRSNFPRIKGGEEGLAARLRLAQAREVHAENVDTEDALWQEENMWRMLGRKPPEKPAKLVKLDPPPGGMNHPLDDLIFTARRGDNVGGALWEADIPADLEEAEEREVWKRRKLRRRKRRSAAGNKTDGSARDSDGEVEMQRGERDWAATATEAE